MLKISCVLNSFIISISVSIGLRMEEVTGGWRRLRNEELHNLHVSPNIIRVMKSMMIWAEHVVRIGEMRKAYKFFCRKTRMEEITWNT